MSQLFLNPHHIMVWRKVNSIAVRGNPNNQSVLLVQLGLNRLYNLYVQKSNVEENTITVRTKMFSFFKEAAENGNSRGMFFEGLCYLFGFGCKTDALTGNALIRVAATARSCDFALDCLNLCVGVEHLYGKNRPQNYAAAIARLNMAGEIAQPQRVKLAEHFKRQHLILVQLAETPQDFPRASYKSSLAYAS
ncbi:MAG: hypothetical protein K2P31_02735 [Rickettsiaceae bacterium]|nr:hypothetical protein [Rickettsiaceae bacterium]